MFKWINKSQFLLPFRKSLNFCSSIIQGKWAILHGTTHCSSQADIIMQQGSSNLWSSKYISLTAICDETAASCIFLVTLQAKSLESLNATLSVVRLYHECTVWPCLLTCKKTFVQKYGVQIIFKNTRKRKMKSHFDDVKKITSEVWSCFRVSLFIIDLDIIIMQPSQMIRMFKRTSTEAILCTPWLSTMWWHIQ